MTKPTILVTGAAGKTGAALVRQLRARDVPVRALVHRRDARSAALESLGAEIAVADMFDPDQVLAAMRGTQRAYYLPFYHPYMVQSAVVFADAARTAKLEQLVHMGQWLSHRAHPAIMTRQTWLIDRLFATLPDIAHTTIAPGMFADNYLRVLDFASLLYVFPILTGDGRAAPVANEDMARVAAAVLAAPARHAGRTYRPTGPVLLSGREMATTVARVVGHAVLPVHLPFWMLLKVARRQGVNPLELSGYRHYVREVMRGTFALEGGVTNVVEELTGEPAESFETTVRRYAAMPFARPTARNRARALFDFLRTPFMRGYDLDAWDTARGWPMPPAPSLSLDDPAWRADRARLMAARAEPAPALAA